MIVLDHNAYPHIVDEIVDFADSSVRKAFRATCCYYRDYVDTVSIAHMTVGERLITSDGVLVVPLKTQNTAIGKRSQGLLRSTQTVDVYSLGTGDMPKVYPRLLKHIDSRVHCVRVFAPISQPLPFAKIVVFRAPAWLDKIEFHQKLVFYSEIMSHTPIMTIAIVHDAIIICPPGGVGPIALAELAANITRLIRAAPSGRGIVPTRFVIVGLLAGSEGDKGFTKRLEQYSERLLDMVEHVMLTTDENFLDATTVNTMVRGEIKWRYMSREAYVRSLSREEYLLTMPQEDGTLRERSNTWVCKPDTRLWPRIRPHLGR